ncbi:isoamylase early set domain-containing protein [bacterium]|nr:isoamylase early set domain-containing protein [bacterium]
MSVTKKFTKGSKHELGSEKCRVTFKLSKELASAHQAVGARLAGTFNDWGKEDPDKYVMNVLKNGSFSITITLPANNEYLYKYVIQNANGEVWVVDDDKTVETRVTDFENSYISTYLDKE